MPVLTTLADPAEPPHGTTGHLYDSCQHPDCVALRKWLGERPPMRGGRGRRLTGAPTSARDAWHAGKPRSTRRRRTHPSGSGPAHVPTGEEES